MAGYRAFAAGKRYWWSESRKKRSKRHRKAHYKGPNFEHVMSKNKPRGPLS